VPSSVSSEFTDVPTETPTSDINGRETGESANGGTEGAWWERWYIWLAVVVLLSICVLVAVLAIASKSHTEYTNRLDAAWMQRVTQSGAAAEEGDSEDDEIDRQLEEWAGAGADDEFDAHLAEWAREADAEDERAAEREPFM